MEDRVVYINRVSKAVSGGSTFSFSTMVAVGNRDGKVGIGIGRDEEVPASIEKARRKAKDDLIDVSILGNTIPHEIETNHDSARVLLKPAAPGTGVIAGGAIRPIVELAGIRDILTKSLGSDNPLNIARATIKAFQQMKDPHQVAQLRGISLDELLEAHPFAGPVESEVEEEPEPETEEEPAASSEEDIETGEGESAAEPAEEEEPVEPEVEQTEEVEDKEVSPVESS